MYCTFNDIESMIEIVVNLSINGSTATYDDMRVNGSRKDTLRNQNRVSLRRSSHLCGRLNDILKACSSHRKAITLTCCAPNMNGLVLLVEQCLSYAYMLIGFQGRGWRRKNLTPFLLKMQWYRDEIARALQKFRRPDIFVNVNMDPPPENYMKAMNSTFGLVLRGDKTYSFRLFEVIAAGAIPVIISVPYVLPFAEILPWHTFSVLWPAGKIHELPGHLDDIAQNPQRLRKMQENLQRAWLNHFQSPEKQVETVKQILQWRRDSAAHAGEGQWDGGFVV
eukprot:m.58348 g.58348  ORF g.58348 m.58348 type:complete len:279 (-) comp15643_c0_seq4:179-1015(-)